MVFLPYHIRPLVISSLGVCLDPATLSRYLDATAMKIISKAAKIILMILNEDPKIPSIRS